MKTMRPALSITILLLLCAFTAPTLAQTADLSGTWLLKDKDTSHKITLQSKGNGWTTKSGSKAELILNPAGLRNQWVGNLKLPENHDVKASLKGGESLEVTDLKSRQTWTLTRSK